LRKYLDDFENRENCYVETRRKSGSSRVDLKDWVKKIGLQDDLSLEMLLKVSGGKTVRPQEVVKALFALEGEIKGGFSVMKTDTGFRIGPFTREG